MTLPDTSGTNIDVQILIQPRLLQPRFLPQSWTESKPVLIVMDYAFGEQAYETIDELLKPFKKRNFLNVESVSIMGKAGILEGEKEIL
jgi:hypothetical protein